MLIENNKKKEIIIIKYNNKGKNKEIRLLGESFFKNNKDKWKMIIDGEEMGVKDILETSIAYEELERT